MHMYRHYTKHELLFSFLPVHPSQRRIHLSAACVGQAHSPVTGAMHSCVCMSPQKCLFPWRPGFWTSILYLVALTHMCQPLPKRHLDRFSRLAQLTRVPNTETTLRATSLAVAASMHCVPDNTVWHIRTLSVRISAAVLHRGCPFAPQPPAAFCLHAPFEHDLHRSPSSSSSATSSFLIIIIIIIIIIFFFFFFFFFV